LLPQHLRCGHLRGDKINAVIQDATLCRHSHLFCRKRAAAQTSGNVDAFWPTAPQCRSSDGPSSSELRENAREVCAARWYDPSTGEFLSVDPDFDQTLDAYGYATRTPSTGRARLG